MSQGKQWSGMLSSFILSSNTMLSPEDNCGIFQRWSCLIHRCSGVFIQKPYWQESVLRRKRQRQAHFVFGHVVVTKI